MEMSECNCSFRHPIGLCQILLESWGGHQQRKCNPDKCTLWQNYLTVVKLNEQFITLINLNTKFVEAATNRLKGE